MNAVLRPLFIDFYSLSQKVMLSYLMLQRALFKDFCNLSIDLEDKIWRECYNICMKMHVRCEFVSYLKGTSKSKMLANS